MIKQNGRHFRNRGRQAFPENVLGLLLLALVNRRRRLVTNIRQGALKSFYGHGRHTSEVLSVFQAVLQADLLLFLTTARGNVSHDDENLLLPIGHDDVAALRGKTQHPSKRGSTRLPRKAHTYRKELQVHHVLAIAELELQYPVCTNLRHLCASPRLEDLPESRDEGRRDGLGRPRKLGQVASKTRVDDEVLLFILLGKLEEEDLGREVVDIGQPKVDDARRKLVGDDLSRMETVSICVSLGRQVAQFGQ